MKRSQGQDNFDDKKARFAGRSGPPARGGYPQRGGFDSRGPQRPFRGEGSERRGNDDEGYAPRRPFAGRDERSGGGGGGGFDRQSGRSFGPRNTFRREDGAQGGYGTPQRFNNDHRAPAAAAPAPRPMAAPVSRPVPVARLKEGVAQANRALAEVIEQFGSTLSGDYDISALEVMVSFSEDGRFLGFGQGGAATMTLSVTPLSAEEILEGEEGELMDEDLDMDIEGDLEVDLENDADTEEDALVHAPAHKKARGNKAHAKSGAESASTDLEN